MGLTAGVVEGYNSEVQTQGQGFAPIAEQIILVMLCSAGTAVTNSKVRLRGQLQTELSRQECLY
jgi:hypothetical protein